jgi:hypothetical protein
MASTLYVAIGVVKCNVAPAVDQEQNANYVLYMFLWRTIMVRAVFEEALALTSLTLFLAMVAVWARVLAAI